MELTLGRDDLVRIANSLEHIHRSCQLSTHAISGLFDNAKKGDFLGVDKNAQTLDVLSFKISQEVQAIGDTIGIVVGDHSKFGDKLGI